MSMLNLGNVKGENGKSAYEIAVANGFEGTEEEWLDSLKCDLGNDTVDSLETEDKTVVGAINEVKATADSKQNKETVLEEFVVNTPIWANQPGVKVSGSMQLEIFDPITEEYVGELLAPLFNTSDFYYVTLNDASGAALPAGQFMLKHFYSDTVPIDCLFHLEGLNTGTKTGKLSEKIPVEFVISGNTWKLRHAGVVHNIIDVYKVLDKSFGKLKVEAVGGVIPGGNNSYPLLIGYASENIRNFHGGHNSVYQNIVDSCLGIYLPLSYTTKAWKHCVYRDSFCVETLNDEMVLTERTTSIIHTLYDTNSHSDTTNYNAKCEHATGMAKITKGTVLNTINCTGVYDCIRNGTVVRITEVK